MIKDIKPDLLIAHPPCTFLSYVGWRWHKTDATRMDKTLAAVKFFMQILDCGVEKICIENPQGYICKIVPPSQKIEPFLFGSGERKRTYLWLKNLPPLFFTLHNTLGEKPSKYFLRKTGPKAGQKVGMYFTNRLTGGHARSKFFPEIAKAMADQWG